MIKWSEKERQSLQQWKRKNTVARGNSWARLWEGGSNAALSATALLLLSRNTLYQLSWKITVMTTKKKWCSKVDIYEKNYYGKTAAMLKYSSLCTRNRYHIFKTLSSAALFILCPCSSRAKCYLRRTCTKVNDSTWSWKYLVPRGHIYEGIKSVFISKSLNKIIYWIIKMMRDLKSFPMVFT